MIHIDLRDEEARIFVPRDILEPTEQNRPTITLSCGPEPIWAPVLMKLTSPNGKLKSWKIAGEWQAIGESGPFRLSVGKFRATSFPNRRRGNAYVLDLSLSMTKSWSDFNLTLRSHEDKTFRIFDECHTLRVGAEVSWRIHREKSTWKMTWTMGDPSFSRFDRIDGTDIV